jgi:hypothetical protein
MSAKAIARIEKTRGQKLSEADAARLRSIGEALTLREGDALWDVLAVMEYQRAFYEALPAKITCKSRVLVFMFVFFRLSQIFFADTPQNAPSAAYIQCAFPNPKIGNFPI